MNHTDPTSGDVVHLGLRGSRNPDGGCDVRIVETGPLQGVLEEISIVMRVNRVGRCGFLVLALTPAEFAEIEDKAIPYNTTISWEEWMVFWDRAVQKFLLNCGGPDL